MMGFGGLGLIIIIVAIYLIIKYMPNLDHHSESKETALDILKKRFANGEISNEEFKEKKKNLL
jgi:putative membrane protein